MMKSPHQQLDLVTRAAIKGNLDAVKRLVAMRTTKLHISEGLLALLLCDHPYAFEQGREQDGQWLVKKAKDVSQTHYNRIAFYLMKNCDFDILMLDSFLGDLKAQPENPGQYYIHRLIEKKHPMPGQDAGITLDTVLGLDIARDDEDFLDLPQFQLSMRMNVLKNELIDAIVANDMTSFNGILASLIERQDQHNGLFSVLPDSLLHSLCSTLRAFNYESKAECLMQTLSSKEIAALINGILMDFNAMRVLDDTKNIARIDSKFLVRILEISDLIDEDMKEVIIKSIESNLAGPFSLFCQENNAMHLLANESVKEQQEVATPNGCCSPCACCPPGMELQKEPASKEDEPKQDSWGLTAMYQRFVQSLDLEELSQNMHSFEQEDRFTQVNFKA